MKKLVKSLILLAGVWLIQVTCALAQSNATTPENSGIVPIGAANKGPASVASPDQPAKMDYSSANPDDWEKKKSATGLYISPELGAAFNSNLNFKTATGTIGLPFDYELTGSATASMSVNPGIRFNFPVGYRPVEWFGVEFAPGIIWNSLNTTTIGFSGSLDNGEDVEQVDNASLALKTKGGYYQVPLVVNFIFRIPTGSPWTPYVGGGVGASYNYLNITNYQYAPAGLNENVSSTDGSCWSFTYQAIGGFDYQVDENISLGAKYIFTGTGNQNFGGDLNGLNLKNSFSQSAMFNCTVTF